MIDTTPKILIFFEWVFCREFDRGSMAHLTRVGLNPDPARWDDYTTNGFIWRTPINRLKSLSVE